MISLVGWIATIATMIAAMMTASNLGARVTGWGFVVFSVSSVCWTTLGYATGQTALVATNGFLMVTNLVGIWRWLGQQTNMKMAADRPKPPANDRKPRTCSLRPD